MRVFKKEKNEIDFFKNGYVKFQLLDSKEVEAIKKFYQEEIAQHQNISEKGGFHTTSNTHDLYLLNKVDKYLKTALIHKIDEHLINVTYTICNYLVKESDQNSEVPPHQDWLLVDETRFTSFNIWICIDPANENSGCLKVIPKSHHINFSHRAESYPRYFDQFMESLSPHFIKLPTNPGECIVFHNSIIHSSDKNISGKQRISCVVGAFESNADLLFFKPSMDSKKIIQYQISPKTFLTMEKNYFPTEFIKSIKEVDLKLDLWNYEKFKQTINTK